MHIDEMVKTTSEPSRSHAGDSRGKNMVSFDSRGMGEATGYFLNNISNQNQSNERYAFPQPILPRQDRWRTSNDNVSFPPIKSTLIQGCVAKDVPQGVLLQAVRGILQIQEQIICDKSNIASDYRPTYFPQEMNSRKVYPSVHVANTNSHKALIDSQTAGFSENCETPKGRELIPYHDGGSVDKLARTENSINDQNHTLSSPESIEEGPNSYQPSAVAVASPRLNPRKRNAAQNTAADRLRKAKITEGIKSLEGLLPNSGKGNQECVMDDIINYVKYLQLQVKVLSRNRLGGEATSDPFIHLEGFGHYLVHQQNLNEPLEELIGEMMEDDMPAAIKLLETKGLYVMPISFTKNLSQSTS